MEHGILVRLLQRLCQLPPPTGCCKPLPLLGETGLCNLNWLMSEAVVAWVAWVASLFCVGPSGSV